MYPTRPYPIITPHPLGAAPNTIFFVSHISRALKTPALSHQRKKTAAIEIRTLIPCTFSTGVFILCVYYESRNCERSTRDPGLRYSVGPSQCWGGNSPSQKNYPADGLWVISEVIHLRRHGSMCSSAQRQDLKINVHGMYDVNCASS